jgi:hypothetical protein
LGARITVLDAAGLRSLEETRELPEVVVLGEQVTYVIEYDRTGVLNGARKLTDPQIVRACREEIAALHRQGEDLLSFCPPEIASLGPPIA